MDPLPALPAVAGAVAYARRARSLRDRGRPVRAGKRAVFAAGVVVVALAVVLPDSHFWAHMGEHLMLGDLGPLLIVAGLDGALLRPLLALRFIRPLRALGHPLVALPVWLATFVAWHLAPAYDAALHHAIVHALQHFSFFFAGCLMWAAVFEPLPAPDWFGTAVKAAYVLLVRAVGIGLANVFIWSTRPFYDGYSLHDQRIGGLVMFTEGGVVTLVVFAWLFLRWQAEAERRQQLIEQGYDSNLARRTARHWPRLQQPPGRARSNPSAEAPDRPS